MSPKSIERLRTAHADLHKLAEALDKVMPIQVLYGYRNKEEQQEAYLTGHSKAQWGESPHNFSPAMAIDLAPLPIDWKDIAAFDRMVVEAKRLAQQLGIKVTCGADFKSFKDRPHIEITGWKSIVNRKEV